MIGTLEIIAADGTKKIRKKKKAKCEARIWGDELWLRNSRECWLVWEMEPDLELEPGDVGSTVLVFPPKTVHLFTDDFALGWISWDQSGSISTAVTGTHGNLTPEAILGFQNEACSFGDDFIPPGTFDLSYGLSVTDLSPSIHSYCRLRIED